MLSPAVDPASIASQTTGLATANPTTLALLSIFGGAALTVIAGFIGAWIQAAREHRRWIRERRYEAFQTARLAAERYRDLGRVVTALKAMPPPQDAADRDRQLRRAAEAKAQHEALRDSMDEAFTPLLILGPQRVMEDLGDFATAVDRGDGEAADAAEGRFILRMRRALKVRA
ncbi:hypothetical protein [Microbacterium sp. Leaf179]|uniref:hypothetical protein n=1 Tax=Microbacterium sp. Leaf179 TaxID=1736288 RepID=UPI0006F93F0F|nr:hypothetical protein [Microbacterium sp. Leaf179]KQR86517.1 hypothetical protein ASF96_09130 [Microbacterium sp. Leaf179]